MTYSFLMTKGLSNDLLLSAIFIQFFFACCCLLSALSVSHCFTFFDVVNVFSFPGSFEGHFTDNPMLSSWEESSNVEK